MSERTEVQDPLIRYAAEVGWTFIPRDDALTLRGGETGLFFGDVLAAQLRQLNPRLTFDPQTVIRQLENVRAGIEGNHETLLYLRGQKSIYDPAQKRELNLTLIDFDNPDANVYHVTDEWEYTNGRHANRGDVMFLINGIPLALVETKGAKKRDGVEAGLTQVRRYHRETPEMLTAPQVWDVTHFHDFYYGVTWELDRKSVFNWKDELTGADPVVADLRVGPDSEIAPTFERKVKAFFDRLRLLRVLRDYILFTRKDDELHKFILRQHQARAVEKVVARALDPRRRTGLVWHTQGSGKTFTMIVAAEKLLERPHPTLGKNTVLMIVDRTELEANLFGNLSAYGLKAVEVATSKARLRELLGESTDTVPLAVRGTLAAGVPPPETTGTGMPACSKRASARSKKSRVSGSRFGKVISPWKSSRGSRMAVRARARAASGVCTPFRPKPESHSTRKRTSTPCRPPASDSPRATTSLSRTTVSRWTRFP